MQKQDPQTNDSLKEKQGEELLREYYGQDKDDKHHMGYSVYAQDSSDGCCC